MVITQVATIVSRPRTQVRQQSTKRAPARTGTTQAETIAYLTTDMVVNGCAS